MKKRYTMQEMDRILNSSEVKEFDKHVFYSAYRSTLEVLKDSRDDYLKKIKHFILHDNEISNKDIITDCLDSIFDSLLESRIDSIEIKKENFIHESTTSH